MDRPNNEDQQEPSNKGCEECQADRRKWVKPEVSELPRLTDLTLATGIPIFGSGNPGGGTSVF